MSDTGRYIVIDANTGRKFWIEPIDNTEGKGRRGWGDVNPATGKSEGSYGKGGSVRLEDTVITEDNGFKNIIMIPAGQSPQDYIRQLLDKEK